MLFESKGFLFSEGLRGPQLSALPGVSVGREASAAGLQCFCETVAEGLKECEHEDTDMAVPADCERTGWAASVGH